MKGLKGTTVLIASCVNMVWIGTSIFALPGIMAPYWQSSLNISVGDISKSPLWILLATGIFMFVVGKIQEKFSLSWIVFIGSLILGITNFFVLFIRSLSHIYLWAFFVGCSSAFLYIPCITAVQSWFPLQKGLVVGLVNLIFGISASFLSPVLNKMFLIFTPFYFYLIVSLFSFLTGALASFYIKLPVSLKSHHSSKLEDFSVTQSLKNRNFWLIWICWALTGGAGISMVTLSTLYGINMGLSKAKAVLILSSFNLANGLSRFISGFASDRFGRINTMCLCFSMGGIGYILFPLFPNLYMWCLCAILVGAAFGTLFAVSAPLLVECFGIKHFGAIFGLVFTAYGFVAGPMGPWFSGFLLNLTHSFSLVFYYLGLLLFISSVCIHMVKRIPNP